MDISELKAFADDIFNVAKMTIFNFEGVENTVGKGENADYKQFILFPQGFPKPSSLGSLKVGLRGKELILYNKILTFKYHNDLF